jgi:hypothetical protein
MRSLIQPMSNTGGTVQRLEKIAYLGGLVLLAMLGIAAAILSAQALWTGAVACLGLGLALLAPLQVIRTRRQLHAFKTALRRASSELHAALRSTPPAPVRTRTPARAPTRTPAHEDREVVALLSRNNRHIVSLAERLEKAQAGPVPAADMDRLTAETALLRSELARLRTEQEQLRVSVGEGWTAVRADLNALSIARGNGHRDAEPGRADGQ